jgi:hypothetical protein
MALKPELQIDVNKVLESYPDEFLMAREIIGNLYSENHTKWPVAYVMQILIEIRKTKPMAISTEYQAYLNSDKWQRKRRRVFARSGGQCERCKNARATQVHHKTYDRIFREPLSDLQAVCGHCHMEIHEIGDKPKKMRLFRGLKTILARVIG